MCLTSGARLTRYRWTPFPMPTEVIDRVNNIGAQQNMPTKLTYANRYGAEIENTLDDVEYDTDDDDDEDWEEASTNSDHDDDDDDSELSYATDSDSDTATAIER